MNPTFWKLSQGSEQFNYSEMIKSIDDRLVFVHKDTKAKGISNNAQGEDFINAKIGDYFYLTYGNEGIFILGQFIGPANFFSEHKEGWMDRQFRLIAHSNKRGSFTGEQKWWTPNDNSTFIKVPINEYALFEELILEPYFGMKLEDYKL
jgi:hypothetical protein